MEDEGGGYYVLVGGRSPNSQKNTPNDRSFQLRSLANAHLNSSCCTPPQSHTGTLHHTPHTTKNKTAPLFLPHPPPPAIQIPPNQLLLTPVTSLIPIHSSVKKFSYPKFDLWTLLLSLHKTKTNHPPYSLCFLLSMRLLEGKMAGKISRDSRFASYPLLFYAICDRCGPKVNTNDDTYPPFRGARSDEDSGEEILMGACAGGGR
jgi:hypothetical protein